MGKKMACCKKMPTETRRLPLLESVLIDGWVCFVPGFSCFFYNGAAFFSFESDFFRMENQEKLALPQLKKMFLASLRGHQNGGLIVWENKKEKKRFNWHWYGVVFFSCVCQLSFALSFSLPTVRHN